ncbi:MAG: MBL fold metallo-hydrolase [Halobacteriota archaeon]|nr:MBL fold metallo-hydrolase [Halobacteriota archaeon]
MPQNSIFDEFISKEVNEDSIALTWFNDYSGFAIKSTKGTILIDPYDISEEDAKSISADMVLVSHGHPDHFNKKLLKEISPKMTVTTPSIAKKLKDGDVRALLPGESIEGEIKILAEKAVHPAMNPITFVIQIGRIVLYHMIDSMNFDELKGIGEKHDLDIAIVPIGIAPGTSPKKGAKAVGMLSPKVAIPHHTKKGFEEFEEAVKKQNLGTDVAILQKGEVYTYSKR